MNPQPVILGPATTDDSVEEIISDCLNPSAPQSFFLYAGAGSGKTRSLEKSLRTARDRYGARLRKNAQRIAVITYTNAACKEIASRVDGDPLFHISTIHSFCWSQIGLFHSDIQEWLLKVLPEEIDELVEEQKKGKAGKASLDRERGIEARQKRLEWLSLPRRFTYNPNGDNFGRSTLSHSEVLKITAYFITNKPSMQQAIVRRFPFLLIDESQDTNKLLMDAFFALEAEHHEHFALGLVGDIMQRIYADGKSDLGSIIPKRWKKPVKKMNHRCGARVIQLANSLRAPVDEQVQMGREDGEKGFVRLFVAAASTRDKPALENVVRGRMAELTADHAWVDAENGVKSLTVEHHMAASRMGFLDLFSALDKEDRNTTGLRNGELAGIRLFSERVEPLINFISKGNHFEAMTLLRKNSRLLEKTALKNSQNLSDPLAEARAAVDALLSIDASNPKTTFLEVLRCVATHDLFEIPEVLKPFVEPDKEVKEEPSSDEKEETLQEQGESPKSSSLESWRAFLESPYSQIVPYSAYVSNVGAFGTHQGVKGREFDRVLVVIDDSEARGFMFSYEKLFGAKPLTKNDIEKGASGGETGMERTRRLLYVTCTRAKKSLALVAYTSDPTSLEKSVISQGWFDSSEIEHI